MPSSSYKVERIAFIVMLGIALLMAFGPLARIHDPNGSQVSNAFDLPSGIRQLQAELRIVAPIKSSLYRDSGVGPAAAIPATPGPSPLPFSIQTASIVPWCVFAALVFSILALLDLLFVQKWFELLSLIGGFSSAIALLYVLVLSSDLLAWTDALMSINELSAPGDPTLSGRILMANSFMVTPGVGLYALAACTLLVPFLSITHTIPRTRAIIRSAKRIRISQPIHIRPINSQYAAETCTSLDLSRSGLYLESPSDHYYVGMEVYLTRNVPAGGPANRDEHGYVVRVEKMGNAGCRFAIHLISSDNA